MDWVKWTNVKIETRFCIKSDPAQDEFVGQTFASASIRVSDT